MSTPVSADGDFDVAGAATHLNTSKKFIRRRIEDGTLNAYRIKGSRLIRIPRADLEALKQPVVGDELTDGEREVVREWIAQAPPLDDEQRAKLAELLRPVRSGGAA